MTPWGHILGIVPIINLLLGFFYTPNTNKEPEKGPLDKEKLPTINFWVPCQLSGALIV